MGLSLTLLHKQSSTPYTSWAKVSAAQVAHLSTDGCAGIGPDQAIGVMGPAYAGFTKACVQQFSSACEALFASRVRRLRVCCR